jgi:tRNA (cmo5U34)-methyltransferase
MKQRSDQFDASAHFDESLASKYDCSIRLFCPSYDALHQMLMPWLQKLPEKSFFLSAGAGTGAEIITLGKRFPSWRFIAVDVSSDMLNSCRKRLAQAGLVDRVDFFNGPMQRYQSSALVDAASSIFVSHFIKGREEKLAYFQAIAANLRTGGFFVLADLFGDTNSPEFPRLYDAWLASYASNGISGDELAQDRAHIESDVSFIPENELFSLLRQAGFSTPIRFYQTYLFGGWVTTKHV